MPSTLDPQPSTIGERLREQGISRRTFLKHCTSMASLLALAPKSIPVLAQALKEAPATSIIYMPFQECMGCAESWTRAHNPSIEGLLLEAVSLDYFHLLQAASGHLAEAARREAMEEYAGRYILMVDGSIPLGNPAYSTIGGHSAEDLMVETAEKAGLVIALGTCASFGGIPEARPNPTGAVPIADLVPPDKPLIRVPGCPPIPAVINAVLAHYLAFQRPPELDADKRPRAFFGTSIHDRCYRRPFYDQGQFADTFDDQGARKGWCLWKLGCKGPTTNNACATVQWNEGTSFPIGAGHGCIGCASANFWDHGGFYEPLATGSYPNRAGMAAAAGVGVAAGVAAAALGRRQQASATAKDESEDE